MNYQDILIFFVSLVFIMLLAGLFGGRVAALVAGGVSCGGFAIYVAYILGGQNEALITGLVFLGVSVYIANAKKAYIMNRNFTRSRVARSTRSTE